MKAAIWVIQFSWDIYCAAEQYLRARPRSEPIRSQNRNLQADDAVGAKLSKILEVLRQFLLQLPKIIRNMLSRLLSDEIESRRI